MVERFWNRNECVLLFPPRERKEESQKWLETAIKPATDTKYEQSSYSNFAPACSSAMRVDECCYYFRDSVAGKRM